MYMYYVCLKYIYMYVNIRYNNVQQIYKQWITIRYYIVTYIVHCVNLTLSQKGEGERERERERERGINRDREREKER